MDCRRALIAAVILLAVVCLRAALPLFAQEGLPVLRRLLAEEQVRLALPEGFPAWLAGR